MALILGIGFPPFRGGLLRYADDIGISKIHSSLAKYESSYGSRFKASERIVSMNSSHARFYL